MVTQATVEGDPITTHFRGRDDLQLFTDSTEDRYGFRGWYEQRCHSLTDSSGFLEPGDCGNERRLD